MSMLPPETDPGLTPGADPIATVDPGADTTPQTIDDTAGPDDSAQRSISAMLDEAESRLDEAERNVADLLVQSMTDVPIDREDIVLSETGDATRPGILIPQDPAAHPTGPTGGVTAAVDLPDAGGFDANGVWHDGGNGKFARKGWSTAKAAMLRLLRDPSADVLDGRGHGATLLKLKDRGLADRLGADSDGLVEATYADAEHAIVTDWRGRKVRVTWDEFDPDFTPIDVPQPNRLPGQRNDMPDRPDGDADAPASDGATRTVYHLTDKAKFKLDPNKVPADNAISITPRDAAGLYVAKDPWDVERWVNGSGYLRPFVAEIEVPADAISDERWANEGFIPADRLADANVKRVIPVDAFARETYGDYGWVEDTLGSRFDTGAPTPTSYERVPDGWRYDGPDVRDMPADEVKRLRAGARVAQKARTTGRNATSDPFARPGEANDMPDRESPEALARRIIPGNLASPADYDDTKARLATWPTRDLVAAHGTLDVADPTAKVDDALTVVGLEGRNRGIEFGYDDDGHPAAFRWNDDPNADLGDPLTPADLDALNPAGDRNDMPARPTPVNANVVTDDAFHEYTPLTIPAADLRRGDIILDDFNTADHLVTGRPRPDGTVNVVDPFNPDANRTLTQWTPTGDTVTIASKRLADPTRIAKTGTPLPGDDNPALHGTHHLIRGSRYDGEWNIVEARPVGDPADRWHQITDDRGRIWATRPDDMFPTEQAARAEATNRRNPRRTETELNNAHMARMGEWGYLFPRNGIKPRPRNTTRDTYPTPPPGEPNDYPAPPRMPEATRPLSGDAIRSMVVEANGGLGSPAVAAAAEGRPVLDVSWEVDGENVALTRTPGVLTGDGGFLAGGAPDRVVLPVSFGSPEWQAEGFGRSAAGYGTDVRLRPSGALDGRVMPVGGGEMNDMPVRPLPAPDERGVYPTVEKIGLDDVQWTTGPDPDFPEDTQSVTEIAGQFVGADTTEHPFNRTAIYVRGADGYWTWDVDGANPVDDLDEGYWTDAYRAKVDPFAWSDPTDAPSWYESGTARTLEQAQADAIAAANRLPAMTVFRPLDTTHREGLTDEVVADSARRAPVYREGSWLRDRQKLRGWDTGPAPTGEVNDFRNDPADLDPASMSYTDLGQALTKVKADLAGARDRRQMMAARVSSTTGTSDKAPFRARLEKALADIRAGQQAEARLEEAIAARGLEAHITPDGWLVGPPEHFQPIPAEAVPTPPTVPAVPGDGPAAPNGAVPDIDALRAELADAERALRIRGIDREAAENRRAEAFLALAQAEEAERQANGVTVEYPAYRATVLVPPDADNPGTLTYDPVTGGRSPMKLNAPHGVVVVRGTIADPQFDARTPEEAWKRTKLDQARPGYKWGVAHGPEPKLLILTEATAARWKAAYEGTIAEMDAAKARRAEATAARKAARAARQASFPDPNDVADMAPAERLAKSPTGTAWLVAKDNYLSRIGVEKGQAVQVRADGNGWVVDVLDGGDQRPQAVKLDRFADTAPAGAARIEVPEARGNAAVAAKADAAAATADRVRAAGDAGAPVEVADSYLTRYGAPKGTVLTVSYLDDRNAVLNVEGRQVKAGWARFTPRIPEPTGDGGWNLVDPPVGESNDMPDRADLDHVVDTALRQIGGMNLMAISGGRHTAIRDGNDETVGVRLPVAAGYRVDVALDRGTDTYTVTRVFSRGGRDFPKGSMSLVYGDQLGDIAYLASNYLDPFGTAESNDMADSGQLNLLDLAPDEMRAVSAATPVFAAAGWYPTDTIGGFRSPDGTVTVTRARQNNGRMVFSATSTARSVFTNAVGEYRNDDPDKVIAWAAERAKFAAEKPVDTTKFVDDDRLATIAADPNMHLYPVGDLLDSRKGRYGILAGSADVWDRTVLGQWRTPQEAAGAWTDIRRRVAALAADPAATVKLDAGAAKAPTFARPATVKASAVRPGDWLTSIQGVDDIPAEGVRVASAPTMGDGQVRLELETDVGPSGDVAPRYETISPLAAVSIYRPIVDADGDRPTYTESVGPVALAAMTPEQTQAVVQAAHRVAEAAPIGSDRHTEAARVADSMTVADRSPESVDGKIVEASSVHLDPTGVPPKPGTAPIPEGAIRLYHYPQDTSIDSVLALGIGDQTSSNVLWAQTRPPVGDVIPYVEFWTNPANLAAGDTYGKGHVALAGPVPAENIVSYSTPTINALRTFRAAPALWTADRLTSVLGRYPAGSPEAAAVRARLTELGVDLTVPTAGEGNDFRPFDMVRSAMTRTPDREYLVALASTGVPNGDGRVLTAAEIRAMSPTELASLDRAMSSYLARHPYGDNSGTDPLNSLKIAPDTPADDTPAVEAPAPARRLPDNGGTLGYIPMSPLDAPADWEQGVAAAILAEVEDIPLDGVTAAMDLSDQRLGELLVAYGTAITDVLPDGTYLRNGPSIDDVGVQHPIEPVPDLIREVLRLRDVAEHYGATEDVLRRAALGRCPNCGASWRLTELVGEANVGGGYRVRCHECGHEWDDPKASHAARGAAAVTAALLTKAEARQAFYDRYGADADPDEVMARILAEQEPVMEEMIAADAILAEVEDVPMPVVAAVLTGAQHDQRVAASKAAAERRRQRSLGKAQARHTSTQTGNKVNATLPGSTTQPGNSYPHRPAGAADADSPDAAARAAEAGKFFDAINKAFDDGSDLDNVPGAQFDQLADGLAKAGYGTEYLNDGRMQVTDPKTNRKFTMRRRLV